MKATDIGGAFTDPVYHGLDSRRLATRKTRTRPYDPSERVMIGIRGLLDAKANRRRDRLRIPRGNGLTGVSPQDDERPINPSFEGTTDCAIWRTPRSIVLYSDVYGDISAEQARADYAVFIGAGAVDAVATAALCAGRA